MSHVLPLCVEVCCSFKREYEIKLKPDARPYALHTARTVSLPLCTKVKEELDKMESLGVIS